MHPVYPDIIHFLNYHYKGVTVKIQQVAVRGNYENPSNDAKGEDE